jgi:hypothetical protein
MTVNTPTLEQVLTQAQALSALDKVRLMERLFASIERDMEALDSPEMEAERLREWRVTVERTAGALADDPLERPPQGDYELRDDVL